jgi:hypothetical protein
MKKLLLVIAALLVATSVAQAHVSEHQLFTCEGELMKGPGKDNYYLVKSWQEERASCFITEGKALRQVLAVCRVGDLCTVAAKGESSNGPSYTIQKVFEVQRQPASVVQEYKRSFKQ